MKNSPSVSCKDRLMRLYAESLTARDIWRGRTAMHRTANPDHAGSSPVAKSNPNKEVEMSLPYGRRAILIVTLTEQGRSIYRKKFGWIGEVGETTDDLRNRLQSTIFSLIKTEGARDGKSYDFEVFTAEADLT